jgi:membrane protease YdiL (CAAX protease family)
VDGIEEANPSTPQPSLTLQLDLVHLILSVVLVTVVAISEEAVLRWYLILRFRAFVGNVG